MLKPRPDLDRTLRRPQPNEIGAAPPSLQQARVCFDPPDKMERRTVEWGGIRADLVTLTQRVPFDYEFRSDLHLLAATEYSEREEGITSVEGLPASNLRNLSGKLTFVPAGHRLKGWQTPRVLTRVNFFYIDPRGPLLDDEVRFSEIEFRPRLFFFDAELWRLTAKLKEEATNGGGRMRHYADALSILIDHELIRLNNGLSAPRDMARGGLSGWQQRKVRDYIEDHLSEDLRLADLAAVVEFSPFHFARAFKKSFGVPPHRYHVGQRIERAKAMLAEPAASVTEVALAVGFAETSSFSTAFRKVTGYSPTGYRRSLE